MWMIERPRDVKHEVMDQDAKSQAIVFPTLYKLSFIMMNMVIIFKLNWWRILKTRGNLDYEYIGHTYIHTYTYYICITHVLYVCIHMCIYVLYVYMYIYYTLASK